MNLEEAIKICNDFAEENKTRKIILHKAIETVVEAIENSISKEVIEKKIEELKNKSGGNTYHVQFTINSNINLLKELLEEKYETYCEF